jgi:hypothetical protein
VNQIANPLPVIGRLPYRWIQPWANNKPTAEKMSDLERRLSIVPHSGVVEMQRWSSETQAAQQLAGAADV